MRLTDVDVKAPLKVIQVLHHSLSGEGIPNPNYIYEAGWHVRLTQEILKRSSAYRIECWGLERTLKRPYSYELHGIHCRLFPSFAFPGMPGRELSWSLVSALREEAKAGAILLHLHGIYYPLTYQVALALPSVPKLAQGHGDYPVAESLLRWHSEHRNLLNIFALSLLVALEELPLQIALRNIDYFYAINAREYKSVLKLVSPDRVNIQTMGIDFDFFKKHDKRQARQALNLQLDRKCILYVGALRKGKGVDHLISAFARVLQTRSDCLLIIVGEGREKENLVNQVRTMGLNDRVRFLGWVDNSQLPDVYSAADVCVLPSLSEGLGITAVEALACEVPFIGTSVGGIPYVVDSFESGLLVPASNPGKLSDALLRVLETPGDFSVNRESGKRIFDWGQIAKRTLAMYNILRQKYFRGLDQ